MLNPRGVTAKTMLGFPNGSLVPVTMSKKKIQTMFLVYGNIAAKESKEVFKWFIQVLLG